MAEEVRKARVAHILLMEALGTRDPDFLHGLLAQLANAGTQGGSWGRLLLFGGAPPPTCLTSLGSTPLTTESIKLSPSPVHLCAARSRHRRAQLNAKSP
jgi:hypothetical protein